MGDEQKDFFSDLAGQLKDRNNPRDLKSAIIAVVEQISPVVVSYSDGKIQLHENEELVICEWLRFRCNIDKTTALSSGAPSDLQSAKGVSETHSNGGAPCQMPSAISFLADAITKVNSELLALKCDLKIGDKVVVASLEQKDLFVLIDKVL